MVQPTRNQWFAIWFTVIAAAFLWMVDASPSEEVGRLLVIVVIVGLLIYWRLAPKQTSTNANQPWLTDEVHKENVRDILDHVDDLVKGVQEVNTRIDAIDTRLGRFADLRDEAAEAIGVLTEIRDELVDLRTLLRTSKTS